MFCNQCGQQIPDSAAFCPVCGASARPDGSDVPVAAAERSGFSPLVRQKLSGPLFLAICIIESAAAFFSLFAGFDLFAILFTCSLWMTYAKAKSSDMPMQISGLKFTSGVVKTQYIIIWIVAGLLAFALIVMIAIGPVMTEVFNSLPEYLIKFGIDIDGYLQSSPELSAVFGENAPDSFFSILGATGITFYLGLIITMIIWVAFIIVINILFVRKLCSFAKELREFYIRNTKVSVSLKAISVWLLVLGIFAAVGSLTSASVLLTAPTTAEMCSFICNASGAAVLIVSSVWVKDFAKIYTSEADEQK